MSMEVISAICGTGITLYAVTERKPLRSVMVLPKGVEGPHILYSPQPPMRHGGFRSTVRGGVSFVHRWITKTHLLYVRPGCAFVNDLGCHDLWCRVQPHGSCRSAIMIHESPSYYGRQYIPGRDIEWACKSIELYTDLIFVSSLCQNEWLKYPVVRSKNRFCVPNCCRDDVATKLLSQNKTDSRTRLGLPPEGPIGVCVASIQPLKGQDMVIDCLERLTSAVPNLSIYFVGGVVDRHREWGESLKAQVRGSRFANKVVFLGYRPEAMEFIHAADFVLLPSRTEGLPLTVLEAMALKTAVIASRVGGVPEMIEHGVTGLLFDPDSQEELISGVVKMVTDPQARGRFAAAASTKYWANFSRDQFQKRYKHVFQQIGLTN